MTDEFDAKALADACAKRVPAAGPVRAPSDEYLRQRSRAKIEILWLRLTEEQARGEAADRHVIAQLINEINAISSRWEPTP